MSIVCKNKLNHFTYYGKGQICTAQQSSSAASYDNLTNNYNNSWIKVDDYKITDYTNLYNVIANMIKYSELPYMITYQLKKEKASYNEDISLNKDNFDSLLHSILNLKSYYINEKNNLNSRIRPIQNFLEAEPIPIRTSSATSNSGRRASKSKTANFCLECRINIVNTNANKCSQCCLNIVKEKEITNKIYESENKENKLHQSESRERDLISKEKEEKPDKPDSSRNKKTDKIEKLDKMEKMEKTEPFSERERIDHKEIKKELKDVGLHNNLGLKNPMELIKNKLKGPHTKNSFRKSNSNYSNNSCISNSKNYNLGDESYRSYNSKQLSKH